MNLKFGIVVKNSIIPSLLSWFIKIRGITLWPFIILKDEGDERIINHERIHIMQQRELLVIGFYILYILFWIKNLVKYYNQENLLHTAYANIPFELEAYDNDNKIYYCLNRKRFSWLKYI